MELRWVRRFLDLAQHVAQWSKDPSTKVGAVIVDDQRRVVALGFNGYPRGVKDVNLDDREYKYAHVVHAEANAILNAVGSVQGCTMFVWPLFPCSECAKLIIQSGIKLVESEGIPDVERWAVSNAVARDMFEQAGVRYCIQ